MISKKASEVLAALAKNRTQKGHLRRDNLRAMGHFVADLEDRVAELEKEIEMLLQTGNAKLQELVIEQGHRVAEVEKIREDQRLDWHQRVTTALGQLLQQAGMASAVCPSHGKAVLVCHVDGEPCDDYTLAGKLGMHDHT